MAKILDVALYEVGSGDVISTLSMLGGDKVAAKKRCIRRCTKITHMQKDALCNKVEYGIEHPTVCTQKWMFKVIESEAIPV